MSLTVACVLRSGGVFTPEWVDRLATAAVQHIEADHVICLTDMSTPWPDVDLKHKWPSWFSKLELFRPGLFSGPTVYFDLDTLILGPVDFGPVFDRLERGPEKLAMLSDFYNPKIPASGVMAWLPGPETEQIYHQFAANPEFSSRWDRGDGYHIGRHPHVRLQPLLPGVFGSYKKDQLREGPRGFKVVCQHGLPKFNDLPNAHWMCRAWRGEPYK